MSLAPRIILNGQPIGIIAADDTGNYDATSNPGGWGAPNPARTDLIRILVAQRILDGTLTGGTAMSSIDKTNYMSGAGAIVQPSNGKPYDDHVYDIHARLGFGAAQVITSIAGATTFLMTNADTVFATAIGFTIDSLDPAALYLIDRTKPLTNTGGSVIGALPSATSLGVTYYFDAQGYSLIFQNGQACLNRDIAQYAGTCECCEGADLNALIVRFTQYTAMLQDFATQDLARADALAVHLQQQCYSTGVCKPLSPPGSPPTTLPTAPTITMQPQSQAPTINSNATLSVAAIGTEPLSYQWRKNGVDIPGATSPQLILLNIQASDGAAYSVIVYNAYGYAISNSAVITPGAALIGVVITAQPSGGSVVAGGSHTFTVTATGSAPITYQWRKNGTNIGGATSSSLALTNIQAGDAGNYDCVVSNPVSSVTSQAALLGLAFTARWGWSAAAPATLTDVTNLQEVGSFDSVSGADVIIVNFGGDNAPPHILSMAEPIANPIRTRWFVDVNNNGHIGDPDNDLFAYIEIGGIWRVYFTVFPTAQANDMAFFTV